jgi:hypothetical protein
LFKQRAIVPDKAYCDQRKIDYMPVIFPGFSWYNMHRGKTPFNQIPRRGGNFLWHQSYNAISAGVSMVYIAMYDEVDEGTAMYKLAQLLRKNLLMEDLFLPTRMAFHFLPIGICVWHLLPVLS